MPVSWDFFAKRRLKNKDGVKAWAKYHGVNSYEELVAALNLDDVIPPSREQVEFLFSMDGATFIPPIPGPPPLERPQEPGLATKRFTTDESDKDPKEYGVYKEADESSAENS